MKNLKLLLTVLLSVALMFSISTVAFADNETDDDIWSDASVTDGSSTDTSTSGSSTDTSTSGSSTDTSTSGSSTDTSTESESEEGNDLFQESTAKDTDSTTANPTTTDDNELAYTGVGNSGTIISLIVVVSAMVAIYSAKKFNEYKNL